jgi:hypothetical protein
LQLSGVFFAILLLKTLKIRKFHPENYFSVAGQMMNVIPSEAKNLTREGQMLHFRSA